MLQQTFGRSVAPDAEVRRLFLQLRLARLGDASRFTVENVRRAWQLCVKAFGSRRQVEKVRQISIRQGERKLLLRIYFGSAVQEPKPIVVWFHGGGFVFGDLYTAGSTCRGIAARTGAIVVAVGYGLAPEQSLETARADCVAATRWVFEHAEEIGADPARVAVGGDSAGGTLAALVAHDLRWSDRFRLSAQVLLYPATDLATQRTASDKVPILNSDHIAWIRRQIARVSDDADPRLSPLRQDGFTGLPMTIMVTAGFDPLHDEALAYARALEMARVPVHLLHYPGQFHGFMSFDRVLVGARDALDRVCRALDQAFGVQVLASRVESVSIPLWRSIGQPLWLRPSQRWNELVVACLLLRALVREQRRANRLNWMT